METKNIFECQTLHPVTLDIYISHIYLPWIFQTLHDLAWIQASAIKQTRTAIFWFIIQWVVVFLSDVSGKPIGPILRSPMKMVPIGYPETSLRNYHNLLNNNTEYAVFFIDFVCYLTTIHEANVKNIHISLHICFLLITYVNGIATSSMAYIKKHVNTSSSPQYSNFSLPKTSTLEKVQRLYYFRKQILDQGHGFNTQHTIWLHMRGHNAVWNLIALIQISCGRIHV
jgi:hypothetical protein